MKHFLFSLFRLWVRVSGLIYGAEGINIPLMFMPSQFIAGTLSAYGATVEDRVRFHSPLIIHNGSADSRRYYKNLVVGSDCYFGRELFLDLQDWIVIEHNVTISHRVMILTHTDAGTSPLRDAGVSTSQAPVIIRQGAYIGAHVTLLEGVEIGAGSAIGAGAVVTKSIPPGSVAIGVPARVVKRLQEVPANTIQDCERAVG